MKPRWLNGLVNALAPIVGRRRVLVGSVLAATLAVAHAQEQPPAHWVAYARTTGSELQSRLSEGAGDLITRLHEWLGQRQDKREAPLPVIVRIWISAQGWIERSEFDSLGNVQADADLRAILSARPLFEPPPADMRQPLVLRLMLQRNPDFEP